MQTAPLVAQVQDTGEAIRASFANALGTVMTAIPKLLAFLVILIAGWFLASLIARGIQALLRAIRFNELAERSGVSGFVRNMGVRNDSAGVIASVAKWFIRLIALVVAFDALGLPAVSELLRQLLLWLPNLIVALVVLVIGGLAAKALGNLVRGATAEAGFQNPDLLANVARVAVMGFAIVAAVNQLGIATTLVSSLVIGVIGATALAAGLAFGLGGRDNAARLLDEWGRDAAMAGPKLSQAGDTARRRAREQNGPRGPEMWVERAAADRRRASIGDGA